MEEHENIFCLVLIRVDDLVELVVKECGSTEDEIERALESYKVSGVVVMADDE